MSPKEKKDMTETFRSMVESASMFDEESRIDVVIVSDHKTIVDWKEQDGNRMFEDIVVLYKPTQATNPLDLAKSHSSSKRQCTNDVLGNMLAYSEAYIQQWRTTVTDQDLFKSAKKKFKDHKAIVITGPKGSGKTNFAVNLVSSCYEKNQCVVLTETSEWKHLILGEVSVIIIDEFAGKFKYNAAFAEGWLSKFDLIYAAVNQGKINVIITCEASRFSKVMKMTSGHALLNHRIRLTDRGLEKIVVKNEPVSPFPEEQSNSDTDTHDGQKMTNDPKPSKIAVSEQIRLGTFEAGPIQTIETDEVFSDFCEMPDGTIVVLFRNNVFTHYIAKLDTDNYTTKQSVELPCQPNNISFIGGQEVVIFMNREKQMQHAIVRAANIELKERKGIPVNHDWFKIVRTKDDKYIMCTETTVCIYNLNWEKYNPLFESVTYPRHNAMNKRKGITDVVVGNDVFCISSGEKILIFNSDGVILHKTNRGVKSMSFYNKELLIIQNESSLLIYSIKGNFIGKLIEGTCFTDHIFYGAKENKLFMYSKHNNGLRVCSVVTGGLAEMAK